MVKKIIVAMSTILILVSCLVPFSVSAVEYASDYTKEKSQINKENKMELLDTPFYFSILSDQYYQSFNHYRYVDNMISFLSVPILYYNSVYDYYYFHEDSIFQGNVFGGHANGKMFAIDDLIEPTKFYIGEIEDNPSFIDIYNQSINIDVSNLFTSSNFTPLFDESCSELDKILWGRTLNDDFFNDYYDDVIIEVKPRIESEQLKSWKIDKSFLRPDIPTKLAYDLSDYFFTVSVTNKGAESFEFIMTANSSNYTTRYETNQSMINSSSDILNTFQVDGKALISVEPNSTASFNFNFSEIDHFDKIANSWGGNMYQTFHKIFLNFWTQQFYRMSYDGLPSYRKPVYNEDGTINEEESEKLEAKIFGRSESYLCTYSHDFSFYGNWVTKAEKPVNYDDVVNQLPIADIISGNGYGSVEFDLNPDMDDFKGLLDSSKGFLEFVRYTMANFVPQFFWVLIAVGMTSIIILRILGR